MENDDVDENPTEMDKITSKLTSSVMTTSQKNTEETNDPSENKNSK
jgi:hypothetical protein